MNIEHLVIGFFFHSFWYMKLKIHFDNVNEHSAVPPIHGLWVRARLSICIIRLVDPHITKHAHTHNTQAYIYSILWLWHLPTKPNQQKWTVNIKSVSNGCWSTGIDWNMEHKMVKWFIVPRRWMLKLCTVRR